MTSDYDLIVLGAGATGLSAARTGLGDGRRVLLLDAAAPGGDCTHVGCIPSKALLETARRVQAARDGARYGFTATVEVNMANVTDRVRRIIEEVSGDESPARLAAEGIEFRRDRARFTAPHVLEVGAGDSVAAARIVIATGARPAVPPIPGLDQVSYLTNESIFGLDQLPEHLLVLGGGPIGCELAQAFRRLGSSVTILEAAERLIGNDDPEAAVVLRSVLEREGVTVRTGAKVVAAQAGPTLTLDNGASVRGSHLLVALGRRPRTEDIGLDAAGISVDQASRRIVVDARLRTSQRGVFAAGDCASPYQFTHTGDEQGRIAARNAFSRFAQRFDSRVLPWATFTEPEVGHVGLTEQQAFARYGERAKVAVVAFADQDRARCAGETDGFVKIIAARTTAVSKLSGLLVRVVGMTAVCPVGGELVHEAVPMMKAGTLAARLALGVHAYPTWSLTSRLAAAALFGEFGGRHARPAQADGGLSAWPPVRG